MDSAISSSHSGAVEGFDRLSRAIGSALDRGLEVPLLVLAFPEPAPLDALCVFRTAARAIVRDGDVLAHDRGRFVVAMLAPARAGRPPGASEIRAGLERIAAAISLSTDQHLETGWSLLDARTGTQDFTAIVDGALEHGKRERERHAMLATVGHELRTPLTSIRGYIETLLEDDAIDAQTSRHFLETARREALRLGRLVDGMLEFSMLDLSLLDRRATCDVAEQIGAAVDAIHPLARRRHMTLELGELPPVATARVDGDACVHALLNILENAVKYGRDNGTIAIACGYDDAYVRIAIDDDGPGIPPDEHDAIFRMGVRGGAAARPGSGIGLAVVRAIALRSGGDVSLAASPLGGARFVVAFPRAT